MKRATEVCNALQRIIRDAVSEIPGGHDADAQAGIITALARSFMFAIGATMQKKLSDEAQVELAALLIRQAADAFRCDEAKP